MLPLFLCESYLPHPEEIKLSAKNLQSSFACDLHQCVCQNPEIYYPKVIKSVRLDFSNPVFQPDPGSTTLTCKLATSESKGGKGVKASWILVVLNEVSGHQQSRGGPKHSNYKATLSVCPSLRLPESLLPE